MDKEKVIKGLRAHEKGCGYRSHHCDNMDCPYRYGDESCDIEEMCHDALALLKEQEAKTVESIQMDRSDKWGADLTGYCPLCKRPLKSRFNKRFCGECGNAVKWE